MRKDLYVIGARGAGREFVSRFTKIPGFSDRYKIVGFLDDTGNLLDHYEGYPPIVSSVENYFPKPNDVVACALGLPAARRKYIEMLLARHANFETFVSCGVTIHHNAKIGQGVVIYENSVVSVDVNVGDYVLILNNASLGHDAQIGAYSVMEANSTVCGFSKIGSGVILHTSSVVLPKVKVGEGAIVGAGSVVLSNVKPGITVFGIPATKIM